MLNTGDTVHCELSYNQMVPEGLLHVKDGENILTLSVKEVHHFSFYDEKQHQMKLFYALPIKPEGTDTKREFFVELIYSNDKIAIINHKFVQMLITYDHKNAASNRLLPADHYYLLRVDTGELLTLNKENAILVTKDKAEAIKAFVKAYRIKFKKIEEYIHVLDHYRTL